MEKINEKQLKWVFNKFYKLMEDFVKKDEHTDGEYDELFKRTKEIYKDSRYDEFASCMRSACDGYLEMRWKEERDAVRKQEA